jgi:hypothetical protein
MVTEGIGVAVNGKFEKLVVGGIATLPQYARRRFRHRQHFRHPIMGE